MEKSAKIYVAGHRGLVGSAIVRCLQKSGYEDLVLKTSAELDLTDQQATTTFFAAEKPEYVFLAAAMVGGIHANNTRPAEFIYTNLAIQNNVLFQSYRHQVKKLLFLGSSCIYPRLAPQPMREEYLLTGPLESTNSAYAVAKIAGIEMCKAFNRQYQTRFIPVMPTNLYGPNDNYDLMSSHVMPAMIRKFHLAKLAGGGDFQAITRDAEKHGRIPEDFYANLCCIAMANGHSLPWPDAYDESLKPAPGEASNTVVLWGTGTPSREFLHVDDLADACCYLMNHYEDTDLINIGTGIDLTIGDLAMTVQQIVGFDGKMIFDQDKPDGTPRKLLDVTKINDLGWRALIDLKKGIRQVYDWYCGKGISKKHYIIF